MKHGGVNAFDPMLVSLHDSAKEYSSSKDKAAFEHLVHSVTAILGADLSESEKILAADILITLIRQAEADLRISLSERLAPRDDLPDSLLHYLAYGEIDIAEAVLLYSPLLSDMDLLYIVQSKTEEYWRVIARRAEINDELCHLLSQKDDVETHLNLILNESIELNESALNNMLPSAKKDDDFAESLISYKGLPKDVAVSIYWHVSVALRHTIAERFPLKDADLNEAVEDCVQDFTDTIQLKDNMTPSSLMREVSALYNSQGKITEYFLVATLRRRQGRFFIALFEQYTGLSCDIIKDMMRQKQGQGLAVSCRAMNISKESFVSLFLLSRTIATPCDIVNAEEMKMAMRYYDSLTHKMAKEIMTQSLS
jgi:uncharacterized protein (DUF2336 family)